MPMHPTGRARCPQRAAQQNQMVGTPALRRPHILPAYLGRLRAGVPTICGLTFTLALLLPFSLYSAEKLSEKSPFLPPGHGAKAPEPPKPAVQPQGPISREIEFRGIIQLGGVYQFSIFNKKEQKGYWLKENENQSGISVRGYDPASSTVVVNMNGRSERLTLMAATDNPLPVAQAQPATPNNNAQAGLPPEISNQNQGNSRRVIPRRRVILPKQPK